MLRLVDLQTVVNVSEERAFSLFRLYMFEDPEDGGNTVHRKWQLCNQLIQHNITEDLNRYKHLHENLKS
jgi:hypothetical protein